jgi:hypothetical protein
MPRTKVYVEGDPDTSADSAAQNSNGDAGWEAPAATPIGTGKHKGRHMDDGNGVCLKCGLIIADIQRKGSTPRTGSTRSSNSLTIEMIASMAWLGAGIGLQHLPAQTPLIGVIAQPVALQDAEGRVIGEGAAPSVAAGRVMQLEASIAGKRIDRAIKGTVVAKFINAILNMSGPWAELVPLLLPPLIIGGVAAWPSIVERFPVVKGMMIAAILPVLVEASKLAENQAALMSNLESVSQENIAEAVNVINSMLSPEPKNG